MYDIQLFGRLEVRTRGVRLSGRDFGGTKPRHILALLALRGPLGKGELIELLWDGRPPANHKATVESYVSVLRHRLDPDGRARDSAINTRSGGGYALVTDRVRVDVARFDELVAAATGRSAAGALRPLTAAAELAGRPLLEEEAGSEWAGTARAHYRGRLVGALLEAGGHALAADAARALAVAERAVALDPMAERGWVIAMAAHRALGDRVQALRAYDRCRRQLADGLGVEPSAETRALFLDLLREDGAGTALDDAIAALLAAAGAPHAPGTATGLLRRATDFATRAPLIGSAGK